MAFAIQDSQDVTGDGRINTASRCACTSPTNLIAALPNSPKDNRIFTCIGTRIWLTFQSSLLAITLEALAEDAAARQRSLDQIQLVWTSPDEEGPHVRDTSVVVRQLLSEARQSLWISTYSIFNGQEVFLPIEEAWSVRPELEVVLILNIPPNEDAAPVEKYAWSFWKYHWPWTRKPAVFYDPRGPEKTPATPACQHAKCILVDGVTAFITSANFTESAHERNIELGVLFRDNPRVVESIRLKFESLIQNGFLKPLPAR